MKKVIGYTISTGEEIVSIPQKNIPDGSEEGRISKLFWDAFENDRGFPGFSVREEFTDLEEAKSRLSHYASTYIADNGNQRHYDIIVASLDAHTIDEDGEEDWETVELAFDEA